MTEVKSSPTSKILCESVVRGLQEKKGLDITVINLKKIPSAVADYFVICSGNSDTHIDALADAAEEMTFKESKSKVWKREGRDKRDWILLDYVNVVVHVFKKEVREFYALEKLWGDAQITRIKDL